MWEDIRRGKEAWEEKGYRRREKGNVGGQKERERERKSTEDEEKEGTWEER